MTAMETETSDTVKLQIQKLTRELADFEITTQSLNAATNRTITALNVQRNSIGGSILGIAQNITANKALYERRQQELDILNKTLILKQKELAKATEDNNSELASSLNDEIRSLEVSTKAKNRDMRAIKFAQYATAVQQSIAAVNQLTQRVNETQQQFGVEVGTAIQLRINDFIGSLKSAGQSISSVFSDEELTRAVSAEEIRGVRSNYQDEFGGLLTTDEARKVAEQARTSGVSPQTIAQAQRVALIQSGNDAAKAERITKNFVAQFEQKGLTTKEALQFIVKNSELMARNGSRFQESMAAAAVDAKKIGIDLNKVSSFGDSIIGNFEGFLENMAGLGAMGLDFDSFRLAQVAQTGSDADLYKELRSQLSGMGKDINNLDRATRLQLEQAVGMSISDLQKMAGVTPAGAGGRATMTPEELQKESNGLLERIAVAAEALSPITQTLANIFGAVRGIAESYLMYRLFRGRGGGFPGRGSRPPTTPSGRVPRGPTTPPGRGGGAATGTAIGATTGAATGGATAARLAYRMETPFVNAAARLADASSPRTAAALMKAGELVGSTTRAGPTILRAAGRAAPFAVAGYDGYTEYGRRREEGFGKTTAAAAGAVKGGGILAGALAGGKVGAAAGGAAGVSFFGVGVAPGAFIGGVGGAIVGGLAGAELGEGINTHIVLPMTNGIEKAAAAIKRGISSMVTDSESLWNRITGRRQSTPVQKKAQGGLIRGPGTSTSDSIPARLSNGEYVLNAKAVSRLGVGMLDKLNNIQKKPTTKSVGNAVDAAELFYTGATPFAGKTASTRLLDLLLGKKFYNLAKSSRVVPGLGAIASGAISGYEERQRGGSLSKSLLKGLFVGGGSLAGQVGAGAITGGNPFAAGAGGVASAKLSEAAFDKLPSLKNFNLGQNVTDKLGGLKDTALNAITSRMPSVQSLLGGGLGGLKDKAVGAITSRIPGVGGIVGSLMSGGGVKGAIGSAAKTGVGKLIGGALGTAIPIPGIGTALGSIVGGAIGKGFGRLFGKKKAPQVSLPVAAPEVPQIDKLLSAMPGINTRRQSTTAQNSNPQISVDTSGIEQKLNNFINALNNMQIVMDGSQVGKVLVNASNAASTVGIFRPTTRTL